jgi:hypothetical protein
MMEFDAYFEKLRRDLLEQFKGKPNIEVFQKAFARQLDDLYKFFDDLNTLRWLRTAEGKQLDGIGDIVVLSWTEALAIAKLADQYVPMDDDLYRLYLTWKIALNTSNCTHTDRHRALKLFWDKTPLIYSEDVAHPATIFITVPEVIAGSNVAVFRIAALIKAAGVALHFLFPFDEYEAADYSGGAVADVIDEFFIEEVEIVTDSADYGAGAIFESIKEVFIEDVDIITDVESYSAGAIYELTKEVFTDNG